MELYWFADDDGSDRVVASADVGAYGEPETIIYEGKAFAMTPDGTALSFIH